MTVIHAFIYGMILSFGLIMPLGLQNIFIFNQGATQKHFLHALPCVITAGICDTLLILLAVFGVSVVVLNLPWVKTVIFLGGFFFLLYMGWLTWKTKPGHLKGESIPLSDRQQVVYGVSVSLLNPHAILDSVAIIGANSLHFTGELKWAYTLGCVIVSWCWFFSLSVIGHFVHRADNQGFGLMIVNKISAVIMWCVAGIFAWQLIR